MREAGIEGRSLTIADPQAERPADLVKRLFEAERPNQLWDCDLTYVKN